MFINFQDTDYAPRGDNSMLIVKTHQNMRK